MYSMQDYSTRFCNCRSSNCMLHRLCRKIWGGI